MNKQASLKLIGYPEDKGLFDLQKKLSNLAGEWRSLHQGKIKKRKRRCSSLTIKLCSNKSIQAGMPNWMLTLNCPCF